MRLRQVTPKKLHHGVKTLSSKINPGTTPFYVPLRPRPDAGPTDCFLNVSKQTSEHGGALLHGWRITELPGIFIEAEFHAIWVSPPGEYVDITPCQGNDQQTLFLPDPDKTFDEQLFNRRDNVRLPLKDHAVILDFIAHRPHFMRTVIEQLLAKDVQVIVITQDHKTWVDMNELYSHKNIDTFQLSKELAGTVALKSSDGLAVMLSRAEPFVSSDTEKWPQSAFGTPESVFAKSF